MAKQEHVSQQPEEIREQAILEQIQGANNIVLTLHPSPDGDSFGSNLAMAEALTRMGKQVTLISGDSPLSPAYAGMPGFSAIQLARLTDIDAAKHDLFLPLDIASWKLVSAQPIPDAIQAMPSIAIDHHHKANKGFAKENLVREASSTAEVLTELFEAWGWEITPSMAMNLMVGIHTDTGGFEYEGCTPHTFEIAQRLARYGAMQPGTDFREVTKTIKADLPFDFVRLKGIATANAQRILNNQVVFGSVTQAELHAHGIEQVEGGGEIATELRNIRDAVFGVSLIELPNGSVKISFRNRDAHTFPLNRITDLLREQGLDPKAGGHPSAAKAELALSIEEAKSVIADGISQVYSLPSPSSDTGVTI